MDLDLLRARKPDDHHKKNQNNILMVIMTLNLILDLHTLLANPKLSIVIFIVNLIIFLMNDGTTQSTSSPLPQKC